MLESRGQRGRCSFSLQPDVLDAHHDDGPGRTGGSRPDSPQQSWGMFTFDAMAFTQVTSVFWIMIALAAALLLADSAEKTV